MTISMLQAKLHRATVTGADLNYEGSIGIDPALLRAANLLPLQQVEIYNIATGVRFSTYIIAAGPGEVSLNGAAARLVQPGDRLIICAYGQVEHSAAPHHTARIVLLGDENQITQTFDQTTALP